MATVVSLIEDTLWRNFIGDFKKQAVPKGILHRPGAFSARALEPVDEIFRAGRLDPLEYEGEVSRFEQALTGKECLVLEELSLLMQEIERSIGYPFETDIEHYLFEYRVGQGVPEHQDGGRHLAIAMIYCGEFTGGAYQYRSPDGRWNSIVPRRGDLLLSINVTHQGGNINPPHLVRPVKSGVRRVVAVSLVNTSWSESA